jgi:predicted restriction endonuclease
VLLSTAIERLYDLNVGTTPVGEGAPHERPHKPLLLLAVFDLIDEGLATPTHIPWCQALRDRFSARLEIVRKHNDQNNPDLPFRYLAGHGFWLATEADGGSPIRREIRQAGRHIPFGEGTARSPFPSAVSANRAVLRTKL